MAGLAECINNTNWSCKLSVLSSTCIPSLYFRVHVSNGHHPQPTSLLCGCRKLTVYGHQNGHLMTPPSPFPSSVSYVVLPANFWDGKWWFLHLCLLTLTNSNVSCPSLAKPLTIIPSLSSLRGWLVSLELNHDQPQPFFSNMCSSWINSLQLTPHQLLLPLASVIGNWQDLPMLFIG